MVATQAKLLHDLWVKEIGRVAPQTIEALQADYTVNTVGDPNVWELACWMHRAHTTRLQAFLLAHKPLDTLLAQVEHAFATCLTRLRRHIGNHSINTQEAWELIASWRAHGPTASLPTSLPSPGPSTQEAMRLAAPSLAATFFPSPGPSTQEAMCNADLSPASTAYLSPGPITQEAMKQVTIGPKGTESNPIELDSQSSVELDLATAADNDNGSNSSTTPTAPWPHAIPQEDWPSEWGSHTPSDHSSLDHNSGDHLRHPIVVDTPSAPTPESTQSPPTDMGHLDPKGRMSTRGAAPRLLSPMEVVWAGSTQSQQARATLDELRNLLQAPPPPMNEVTAVFTAQADDSIRWAENWANTIAPLREGYVRYTLSDPIPPLAGGNRIKPPQALDAAFRIVKSAIGVGFDKPGSPEERSLAASHWFRGASALLGATIRGMLVSQGFFDQGLWPLDPCIDTFTLAEDLERPSTQLELLRSMAEQLLSELTVQGEDRLNWEDLWNSVKEQEILMLRDGLRAQHEKTIGAWERKLVASLKGKAIDVALAGLIEDLEAEGSSCESGAERAKQVLMKVKKRVGRKPVPKRQITEWQNEYVQEAHEATKAEAYAQAEAEWRTWKETELAKASGEAMRRLSIDYIIERCGPDVEAIIAEKRAFAKDYVHCNYQTWVDQALTERWPSIEEEAQRWTQEDALTRELWAIYPDIWEEAYSQARKDAKEAAAWHKEKLTMEKIQVADRDHRAEVYKLTLKASGSAKKANAHQEAGKKTRKRIVDLKRSSTEEINQLTADLDHSEADPIISKEDLIATEDLHQIVLEDANYGSGEPPNMAAKLGVAMGMVQPIHGLAPQVRPHLGFAPKAETIGEPTPTPSPPHLPVMIAPIDVNEEVAEGRTLYTSIHAPEVEPSPSPAVTEQLSTEKQPVANEMFAMLQQLIAPLHASIDLLARKVNEIDECTAPKPKQTKTTPVAPRAGPAPLLAKQQSPIPPLEAIDEDFLMLASLSLPAPSLPGPPAKAATKDASTAVALSSPPTGASTSTSSATLSPTPAPSPNAPKPKGKKGKGASTAEAAPSPQQGASTATDNDGFITVTQPRAAYSVVMASQVTKQREMKQQANAAAAAQQRTAAGHLKPGTSPAPRNMTRIVVSRNGGFANAEREKMIHATLPGIIAQSICTAIKCSTPNPIRILSAQWAKGVEKTGNFVYNITGKIPMERILQFSKFLLQPFPGGILLPSDGWHWAQLRNVILWNDDGTIKSEEQLLTELSLNPVFQGVAIIQQPHWLNDITNSEQATSMVMLAYIDPTGTITVEAMKTGIFMFNFRVKFSTTPSEATTPKATKPKARIVLPHTDTAKAGETSTEHMAARHQPGTPSEVQPTGPSTTTPTPPSPTKSIEDIQDEFPPLPSSTTPGPDRKTLAHIEDRMHQLMLEATTGTAMVQVGELWYRCLSTDLNIPFRRLRDKEFIILAKRCNGKPLTAEDNINFLAKYEREACKSCAFGNYDLHRNPTNKKLTPSAVLATNKPPLPL
ncbi:hypothetical protein EDB92DRAFT_1950070 [Lactarius akahatsu]|uniref:Uncharacterized protein n=1 Tax=Lactarius akahatsu TaxID=416441 RepID=A0AAD4Q7V7_9AGAM|nr:hypothetical protein EDB92DRAFT_1950070 [Lactarius akahatsu]